MNTNIDLIATFEPHRDRMSEDEVIHAEFTALMSKALDGVRDADESIPDFPSSEIGADESGKYAGPMLGLRTRSIEGKYVKALNGQPCCGDTLAEMLGSYAAQQVIRICAIALDIPADTYAHLNVGQQSMNMRNRLRAALRKNVFGMGVVHEAIEDVKE